MNFILSSQQTLGSGYYFLHFTERRVWLCGAEMVRGRAGMGAWKGRLRGSALTHFKAVDIMNDYQMQSHHINWHFYAAFLRPLKWWTTPICPTTYIMWLDRLVAVRVSVQDGAQTHDCFSIGMLSLSDITWEGGLSCSADHYSESRVFLSHTWHHYHKILNKLSEISSKGMRRN